MNNPSPLLPQGAIRPRAKSSIQFKILMILGVHVVVIGGMLLQGCKDTSPKDQSKTDGTVPVAADTASVSPGSSAAPTPAPAPLPADSEPVANPSLSNAPISTSVAVNPGPLPTPPAATLAAPTKPADFGATAAPASGDAREYVIAKGDTLGALAHRNGLSLKALMEANPGLNPKKLQIGQKVQIPAATAALATAKDKEAAPAAATGTDAPSSAYVVKSGDMLFKIAKAHRTTVKKIMALNDLKSTSIRVGQKLKLPAAKTSAMEAAPAATASASPMKVSAATPVGSPVAAN